MKLIGYTTVVFEVTSDCNCACTYCYQENRQHKYMRRSVAEACVDKLFNMYEENNPEAQINKQTQGIIIEFIGGEPLLNVKIMDYICSYFVEKCLQTMHPWLTHWRAIFITNGTLNKRNEVKNFLFKWRNFIYPSVSLEGPSSERIKLDGSDTFEEALQAYREMKCKGTKVVLTHDKINRMYDILTMLKNEGAEYIILQANLAEQWGSADTKRLFPQLKRFIDELDRPIDIPFLREGFAQKPEDNIPYCDFHKKFAFSTSGKVYPCMRFYETSLDKNDYSIGDFFNIDYQDKILKLNRADLADEECYNCSIALGCMQCIAVSYKNTDKLIYNKNNCMIQKMFSLLNSYYFDFPANVSYKEAVELIGESEIEKIKKIYYNIYIR